MARTLRILFPLAAVVILGGACSLINSPADEKIGGSGGSGNCGDCSALDDACNQGVCGSDGKCEKKPSADDTKCDDGDFCTDDTTCKAGRCTGGTAHACADKDDCHPGVCDSRAGKCTTPAAPDTTPCDDGNPCDNKGQCMAGTCMSGTTKCNAAPFTTACGDGFCETGVGCKTMPKNQGGDCTDGIAVECATGSCDMGACKPTTIPMSDGNPCVSDRFCIVGTSCQQGVCTGGAKRVCTPPNACSKAECDEEHDVCNATAMPEGSACDTGDPCLKGTTCEGGDCKDGHKIKTCTNNDGCCAAGCETSDNDCGLYWETGVQQNVPSSMLQGWAQCFIDTYDGSSKSATNIPTQCNGTSVLMGCGQWDEGTQTVPTLQILAMGPHDDVFFDCSTTSDCTKQSNGAGFYFSDSYSFGFARGGDAVMRTSCDNIDYMGFDVTSQFRMCVHTGGGAVNSGFRCGQQKPFDASYARVIYTTNIAAPN